MLSNIGGPTLIVILFIVLLLFGAPKLPALAKSLGQSMKILKKEVGPEGKSDAATAPEAEGAPVIDDEVAKAKAEAEAAKRELDELKAQQAKQAQSEN